MVELWRNPSGEVKLSTAPNRESAGGLSGGAPSTGGLSGGSSSSTEDDARKITELRDLVASLKAEIENVSGLQYRAGEAAPLQRTTPKSQNSRM